ncbi:N,N-dimethylformamidase beta subunit family domain-containing protein [Kitasatospora sp. LaBMicrA B282]|uniref:N,N-dimethylformamidase beta subunit family domain-containing protein n=1 Tax=Kitasatospora sp. LaBMicrA B282 TaxID=3420949 RepID=UPI003D0B3D33
MAITGVRWRALSAGLALLLAACSGAGAPGGSGPASSLLPSSSPPGSAGRPGGAAGPWTVAAENALPGSPDWPISAPGATEEIQGFADHAGVRPGAPVGMFVSTTASSFTVRAYRFGWYGGARARLVWSSPPVPGVRQPAAVVHARGTAVAPWQRSLSVPTDGWPPGSYLLRLDAASGGHRWVPLTVESPSVAGTVVLLQAVTSYQAYNTWGGANLYTGPDGSAATRARAVSFDRPYQDQDGAADYFTLEQPLVAFAERLGLPLGYRTGLDLDQDPQSLAGAAAVVSEGHDEYWSPAMRATLTAARDHGSNLAFLGANAIYRRIRFEGSALGADRVEVNYKVPQEDPLYGKDDARVTGNWPDPPDADPQSALTGQAYACYTATDGPLVVADPTHWIWAGTGVRAGQQLAGLVGPEADHLDAGNPAPAPLAVLAHSPLACAFGPATTADTTYYTAPSRAGVFDAGTENWICALRSDSCPGVPDGDRQAVQMATANLLRKFAAGPSD